MCKNKKKNKKKKKEKKEKKEKCPTYPVKAYPCICITKALPVLYYTTYYTCIIEKLNAMLIVNVKNKKCTKKPDLLQSSLILDDSPGK